MGAKRIHIVPERIAAGKISLTRDERHYLLDVLRLAGGDRVTIFDGSGMEHEAEVLIGGEEAALRVSEPAGRCAAPALSITMIVSLIKHKNFDLVARKSAELGAARLIPVRTKRTVKESEAGVDRWRRISAEASRQCGRADIMAVDGAVPFENAVASCARGTRLIAWEGDGGQTRSKPVKDVLSIGGGQEWAIAVGPEGGFESGEVEFAAGHGFVPVSLGGRILRTETVPLAILSIVQYLFGDIGR
jgi:16S rRNA (uracil1498-N3)-methyltransferase